MIKFIYAIIITCATSSLVLAAESTHTPYSSFLKFGVGYSVNKPIRFKTLNGGKESHKNLPVFNLSSGHFLSNNVALEFSAGYKRMQSSSNASSSQKYGILPLSITLQYHVCPHDNLNPYIGIGGSYYVPQGKVHDNLALGRGYGAVAQGGAMYGHNDSVGLFADIKHHFTHEQKTKTASVSAAGKASVAFTDFTIGTVVKF